ncbi:MULTISPECIES: phosphate ABC transporter permease subunit PstC [Prauserella salsuginis group]|uniref:Phosphate transport system permease protein n=2 Tax=Prauserella salsuginis group TaxID=2893672 RepID=A0A839XKI3_9PSEU|nr:MULTISPECIES: phosphate ABC transporter permease subunit PstC [Prauserella salsuginis group]MBB3663077.1 phosphate transport system permease protein [Prauserella sediminis]MCR3721089.1 phosphate transport system permease protein [Prauserella flava]MCR3734830.1 phosphate transport system permease protein [Prauserella salsuginis]
MASSTEAPPRKNRVPRRPGDRIFAGVSTGSGVLILVALAGVAVFLVTEAWPALTAPAEDIPGGQGLVVYIWPLLFGTLISAVLALVIAVPLAVAIALFITYYAPRSIAKALGYIIDLLAAVPSIIFGLWGMNVLAPVTVDPASWLSQHLGWIPFFAGPPSSTGRTMLVAIIVLAVMVLPIITAVVREAFTQTPQLHQEAALAIGATRWEMIRMAALPFGRSSIIGASMLGLGRALGETMAVAMVLSASAGGITFNLISSENPPTIAANIALQFPEATGVGMHTLIASGLVLFAITLVVNMIARAVINRRKDFDGAN